MKTVPMTEALYEYVTQHCHYAHPILAKVEKETAGIPMSQMQISKDQGALMNMLVHLMGVTFAVELGCFTGYSALCVASALPDDGQLFTFDIDETTLGQAEKYAIEAGLAERISFRNQSGKDGLKDLLRERGKASIDLAFLDADKEGMLDYFELCCDLVRPNGLIIADNVMWGGSVIDESDHSPATKAIKAFNKHVRQDPRVQAMYLHISDGLFLLRRLP